MTWRTLSIILAILAVITCAYSVAAEDWRSAIAAGTMAVMFGLEAAGVKTTLGRTVDVLRKRRGE